MVQQVCHVIKYLLHRKYITALSLSSTTAANLDYIANANPSPTLNFLAGSIITNDPLTSTSACFTVPILEDDDLESLESFPLSLTNPTNLIVIDPGRATTDVNIIDDDIGMYE